MFNVFGFYKFKKLTSLKKNKVLLQDFLIKKNIRGTIIIANEGINATISGKAIDLKPFTAKHMLLPSSKDEEFFRSSPSSDLNLFGRSPYAVFHMNCNIFYVSSMN